MTQPSEHYSEPKREVLTQTLSWVNAEGVPETRKSYKVSASSDMSPPRPSLLELCPNTFGLIL